MAAAVFRNQLRHAAVKAVLHQPGPVPEGLLRHLADETLADGGAALHVALLRRPDLPTDVARMLSHAGLDARTNAAYLARPDTPTDEVDAALRAGHRQVVQPALREPLAGPAFFDRVLASSSTVCLDALVLESPRGLEDVTAGLDRLDVVIGDSRTIPSLFCGRRVAELISPDPSGCESSQQVGPWFELTRWSSPALLLGLCSSSPLAAALHGESLDHVLETGLLGYLSPGCVVSKDAGKRIGSLLSYLIPRMSEGQVERLLAALAAAAQPDKVPARLIGTVKRTLTLQQQMADRRLADRESESREATLAKLDGALTTLGPWNVGLHGTHLPESATRAAARVSHCGALIVEALSDKAGSVSWGAALDVLAAMPDDVSVGEAAAALAGMTQAIPA